MNTSDKSLCIRAIGAFAIAAFIFAVAAMCFLVIFAGGEFASLRLFGIWSPIHAAGIVVSAAGSAALCAGLLFRHCGGSRLEGALCGAGTAAFAFLVASVIHGVLSWLVTGMSAAFWLVPGTVLFGGILVGGPAILLGSILGAILKTDGTS